MTLVNIFDDFVIPLLAIASGNFTFIKNTSNGTKTLPLCHSTTDFKDNAILARFHDKLTFKVSVAKRNGPRSLYACRIGAKLEGILRNSMILPDGKLRDDAYYSIVSQEWSDTKRHLLKRIDKKAKAHS